MGIRGDLEAATAVCGPPCLAVEDSRNHIEVLPLMMDNGCSPRDKHNLSEVVHIPCVLLVDLDNGCYGDYATSECWLH